MRNGSVSAANLSASGDDIASTPSRACRKIVNTSLRTSAADTSWPKADRGFRFIPDYRIQRTDNLGEAISFGLKETTQFIGRLYVQLRSLVTNRISFKKNVSGPIGIFAAAADHADYNFFVFLRFLGIISINLAVVNFLPIPVLDGGHMVFLIYEWVRRKPAPEGVRIATTYVGLALIVGLMLYVVYLDVSKFF